MSKDPKYSSFTKDYERLCEFLHPNIGQNIILLAPSSKHAKLTRMTRIDPIVMDWALTATLCPMDTASRGAIEVFDGLGDPFPLE